MKLIDIAIHLGMIAFALLLAIGAAHTLGMTVLFGYGLSLP